ncbi:hypothetical protein AMS62_07420 [Bacillus sp. FJAT-18019]|nr:hypothetical protein AMS62_07420 [Bacillus sp. FJAT-18019]
MVWQTRVKFLANAIGAIILIWLAYTIYISAIHIYFDTSEVRGKFIRSIITVVELNENGVRVEKPANPMIEVTPFLTRKTTLKLYRDVGKWQVITGEIHAEQTLSGKLTYSLTNTGAYLNNHSQAAFILPATVMQDTSLKDRYRKETDMEQIGNIEDGNVAELSFSTYSLMSPEELLKLLDGYDLGVTGMAVYAGELKSFKVPYSVGGETDYYVPHLTLLPMYGYREDDGLSMWQLYFTGDDQDKMSEHEESMIHDLEWIINNIHYNGVDEDIKRLAYLRKNGVQVYGATVTGPVRELEKLKEEQEFMEFRLGRIEVWNWD